MTTTSTTADRPVVVAVRNERFQVGPDGQVRPKETPFQFCLRRVSEAVSTLAKASQRGWLTADEIRDVEERLAYTQQGLRDYSNMPRGREAFALLQQTAAEALEITKFVQSLAQMSREENLSDEFAKLLSLIESRSFLIEGRVPTISEAIQFLPQFYAERRSRRQAETEDEIEAALRGEYRGGSKGDRARREAASTSWERLERDAHLYTPGKKGKKNR